LPPIVGATKREEVTPQEIKKDAEEVKTAD
jgi:hypothetical protein